MTGTAHLESSIARVNVLGVGISVLNLGTAKKAIVAALEQRRKGYICVTGVHGVIESQDDPEIQRIHNRAFLCTPDGMPMVWLGRLRGLKEMDRVYGPDLMLEILAISPSHRYRHFFYGGTQGVTDELERRMKARFPGLDVVGKYEPPFRSLNLAEENELIGRVSQAKPDVVWVGISTPRQEKFMAEFLPKLDTTLMVGVGAAFDFHCGRVKQAPGWMQRNGLEWFHRLCHEPRRLWRRYLRNNPRFVWLTMCQLLGCKRFELE
jgi:N-acetylglucosaminyldiphosphoundecaprenol N-acetyl-beta-D-mannosaminyltransferase